MTSWVDCLVEVSPSKAPGLHAALDDLCKKAGIEKPTLHFVKTERVTNALERFNIDNGAAAAPGLLAGPQYADSSIVMVGDKFRELMGHHNLHAPISDEFRAILAHEIGHIKNGDTNLVRNISLNLSPHLGLVAGIAGVWFYEHLKKQEEAHRKQGKTEEEIKAHTLREWEQSNVPQTRVGHAQMQFLTIGKYIAGSLLGLAVGIGAYAWGHRRIEFKADRVSAELMGDGKLMARALKSVRAGFERELPPEVAQEINNSFQQQNPLQKILYRLSHPSDAERIERLEAWSR